MKVPTKVLNIVVKMANQEQTTPEERGTVLLWAQEGKAKREMGAIEAARKLLESQGATVSASK